jgi:Ca2+-binding RTX toxin-like protein
MRAKTRRSMASVGVTTALIAGWLVSAISPAFGATYSVTNINNSGAGSLRAAIIAANGDDGILDTITFSITGTGPHVIAPLTALPTITSPVIIDGTSEPDHVAGAPSVVIDNANNVGDGLVFNVGGNTVKGLVITRFNDGIRLNTGANTNSITGNFIGIGANGSTAQGNVNGISVFSANNNIGGTSAATRNVISGNTQAGVAIYWDAASGNTVRGNYIGTDKTGTLDRGNTDEGIELWGAPNTTIGGDNGVPLSTCSGACNLISGNDESGIGIRLAEATGTVVRGNFIGTDVTGTLDRGNTQHGVWLNDAAGVTVGGSTLQRNVISGNNFEGIMVQNTGISTDVPDENTIRNNLIGTSSEGENDLGNTREGIEVNGATDTTIGATGVGRNVISGNNGDGIEINNGSANTVLVNNWIGVDDGGNSELRNNVDGVFITNAHDTSIGDHTSTLARNVISGNGRHGVHIAGTSTGNVLVNNSIGTDFTRTAALQNGTGGSLGHGVVLNGVLGNTVGGPLGTTPDGACTGSCNVISGNEGDGVSIEGGATFGSVFGNHIGTDVNGNAAVPNGRNGVRITASNSNTIGATVAAGRNVISGNGDDAMYLTGGATGNVIRGNYIGTRTTGLVALKNGQGAPLGGGIVLINAPSNTIGGTTGTTPGGACAGACNVISGNELRGIDADESSNGLTIQGNYVGLGADGSTALGQSGGITLDSGGNSVGGTTTAARNVVSENTFDGLDISGEGNLIRGNFIGTNAAGTQPRGNGRWGMLILGPSNVIGGTEGTSATSCTGACNLVSGNDQSGIYVFGTQEPLFEDTANNNSIVGNFIGTRANGSFTSGIGNGEDGVRVGGFETGPSTIRIGGTQSGRGNVVANNGESGVSLDQYADVDNFILGNSIHSNGSGLAIDLYGPGANEGVPGVTPNDPGDPDSGPNDYQNFPVLGWAVAGSTTVGGSLNSEPNNTYRIELFSDSSAGNTQARSFLGSTSVTTNADGDASFIVTLDSDVPVGHLRIKATATKMNGTSPGSTSELSGFVPYPADCTITGTGGNDVLNGTAGHDVICGLGGNDRIVGSAGADLVLGGAGSDTVDYSGAGSGVVVDLTTQRATNDGQGGTDAFEGVENVIGSAKADQLTGGGGPNVLTGGGGADLLVGLAGNDRLDGGAGKDELQGGAGEDVANGGGGADVVRGGGAADTLRGGGANDKLYGQGGPDVCNGGAGTDLCDGGAGRDSATACERTRSIP